MEGDQSTGDAEMERQISRYVPVSEDRMTPQSFHMWYIHHTYHQRRPHINNIIMGVKGTPHMHLYHALFKNIT